MVPNSISLEWSSIVFVMLSVPLVHSVSSTKHNDFPAVI